MSSVIHKTPWWLREFSLFRLSVKTVVDPPKKTSTTLFVSYNRRVSHKLVCEPWLFSVKTAIIFFASIIFRVCLMIAQGQPCQTAWNTQVVVTALEMPSNTARSPWNKQVLTPHKLMTSNRNVLTLELTTHAHRSLPQIARIKKRVSRFFF